MKQIILTFTNRAILLILCNMVLVIWPRCWFISAIYRLNFYLLHSIFPYFYVDIFPRNKNHTLNRRYSSNLHLRSVWYVNLFVCSGLALSCLVTLHSTWKREHMIYQVDWNVLDLQIFAYILTGFFILSIPIVCGNTWKLKHPLFH